MWRLILSIILVVTVAGASAASVMHGMNQGLDHTDHHIETTENDLLADAEDALAACCDATSGMGSASCFGDLVTASVMLPVNPDGRTAISDLYSDVEFANRTLAVPTGPPKA